jgi:ABC-type multidrug transport system ATPase subunit
VIVIHGLTKQYRRSRALDAIDLKLEPGLHGLLGPNGAGKTTLMGILATLTKPDSGTVSVFGFDLYKQSGDIRQLLGYVPQHVRLPGQLTGAELLHYAASMKGIAAPAARKREVEQALQEVNLTEKAYAKIKTYSGGMRQRLGIAQALLGDPKLVVLDEPTAGLDPAERIRFRNMLRRWGEGRIILLSTHIVGDIETGCDCVTVLHEGRIRFQGTLAGLTLRADRMVWEVKVPLAEADHWFARRIVVGSRKEGEGMVLRLIAEDCPAPGARAVSPGLEDGYVAALKGGAPS